ncbi:major facilitator superfamily domain-containing protein [Ditylenchus destructor]|nr:major facilitator superfamily domain-containing protein [Ditylenchus destructor]
MLVRCLKFVPSNFYKAKLMQHVVLNNGLHMPMVGRQATSARSKHRQVPASAAAQLPRPVPDSPALRRRPRVVARDGGRLPRGQAARHRRQQLPTGPPDGHQGVQRDRTGGQPSRSESLPAATGSRAVHERDGCAGRGLGSVCRRPQRPIPERSAARHRPALRQVGRPGSAALAGTARDRRARQVGPQGAHGREHRHLRLRTQRRPHGKHRHARHQHEQLLLSPRPGHRQVDVRAQAGHLSDRDERRAILPKPQREQGPGHHRCQLPDDRRGHLHRHHGSAPHPGKPGLHFGATVLGDQCLYAGFRWLAAPGCPRWRHPGPPADVHPGAGAVHTRLRLHRLAPGASWLLVSPAIQGVGAAVLAPSTLALLSTHFAEGPGRTRALSLYAAAAGVGATLGLVLGGLFADLVSWRAGFFINLPIGLLLIVAARGHIAETQKQEGQFDVGGAISSTIGMTALVYGLVRAAEAGWHDGLAQGALVGAC